MNVKLLILKTFERYARVNEDKSLPKHLLVKDFVHAVNVILEQLKKEKK